MDLHAILSGMRLSDILSGLRLLLDSYKLFGDKFKDKKTPERVEEILVEAQKNPEKVDTAEIERSLTQKLEPSDAAIVKGDLELLSLLFLPTPTMDAFDYWSRLTKLAAGLQAFAIRNRLFELRGSHNRRLGEVLLLPRSGERILPSEQARQLAYPSNRTESLKHVQALAFLMKDNRGLFPVIALVRAVFNQYDSFGGETAFEDSLHFSVTQGQQRHWLKFERKEESYHFHPTFQYRLDGSALVSIVTALRDDIHEYVGDVHADEQKISPLFAQIEAFSKGMGK